MKNFKNWIKFLGVYQIAGGIVGIILIAYDFVFIAEIPTNEYYLSPLALVLFGFSIYSGNLLLALKYSEGLKFSLINQIIQTIGFSIAGIMYVFGSGVFLSIGLDLTDDLMVEFLLWTSNIEIGVLGDKSQLMVSFNVVAIYLVFRVLNLRKQHAFLSPRL